MTQVETSTLTLIGSATTGCPISEDPTIPTFSVAGDQDHEIKIVLPIVFGSLAIIGAVLAVWYWKKNKRRDECIRQISAEQVARGGSPWVETTNL